jgi:argininosuccinate lyase
MKGLPLAYNKDMQEDKEGLFDCVDTVLGSLYAMTAMVQTWTVKSETMRRSAEQGFTNATDAADYLVKKGTPFREAHEIVGKLVRYCIEHGKSLLELSLEELKNCSSAFSQDIFEALKLETVVNRRESRGGTGNAAVSSQLGRIQKELTELKDWCGKKRGALVT